MNRGSWAAGAKPKGVIGIRVAVRASGLRRCFIQPVLGSETCTKVLFMLHRLLIPRTCLRFISFCLLGFRFRLERATITDDVHVCQSFCLFMTDFQLRKPVHLRPGRHTSAMLHRDGVCAFCRVYSDLQSALSTRRLRLERRHNAAGKQQNCRKSDRAHHPDSPHPVTDPSIPPSKLRIVAAVSSGGAARASRDSGKDCLDSGELTKIDQCRIQLFAVSQACIFIGPRLK